MINTNMNTLKSAGAFLMFMTAMLVSSIAAGSPLIEKIHLGDETHHIRIQLNERASYKIIQVEPQEFLVAFKSTNLSKKVLKSSVDKHIIKQVKIDKLPNNAVALSFYGGSKIEKIDGEWTDNSAILAIQLFLEKKTVAIGALASKEGLKDRQAASSLPINLSALKPVSMAPAPSPLPVSTDGESVTVKADTPISLPDKGLTVNRVDTQPESQNFQKLPKRPKEKLTGSLDDILREVRTHECSQSSGIKDVLKICEKKNWQEAFKQINKQLKMTAEGDCQEHIYFLRAYLNYKMNRAGQDSIYLDGVTYFQDAINYFPDSPFIPYAMLALGKTFKELKNNTEAKGYFKIVLKDYPGFIGRSEAMYELGRIYAVENKSKKAITVFKQFLSEYPKSRFVIDTRKALGKVLYETNEFKDALAELTEVVAADPKSVYSDKDLLLIIGNLHYQLGNYVEARKVLIQAVNIYPSHTTIPVLITRIADTFRDTNQPEEADKIYQLVMETHPGTDGFAISAMRHAAFLSKRSEKENVYHQLINEFPNHPMAKLARVKLADLQLQAGEYNTSIGTLREMATANLKDLKNEAVYVLESSFEALFGKLSEKGDVTKILAAYERDKRLINRLDNPKIFEIVGTAFLDGHLYSQAVSVLKKAYKLTNPRNRSESLYYRLGTAFQETGKTSQAKELYYAYFEAVPPEQRKTVAYIRMSQLLTAERAHEKAFKLLTLAYQQSHVSKEKVDILMRQAASLKAMGQLEKIPPLLMSAVDLLIDSGEQAFDDVKNAYQFLGETYVKLADFNKAVEAYTMALKFSEERRPPGILFSLAESYRMAQSPTKAKSVLTEILGSGDEFWARVAQEELNSINLVDKLNQT